MRRRGHHLWSLVDVPLLFTIGFIIIILLSAGVESGKEQQQQDNNSGNKEYSRVRQLSGDQYKIEYGVAQQHQDERQQQQQQQRQRPLFAWNDIPAALITTTTSTPPTRRPPSSASWAVKSSPSPSSAKKNKSTNNKQHQQQRVDGKQQKRPSDGLNHRRTAKLASSSAVVDPPQTVPEKKRGLERGKANNTTQIGPNNKLKSIRLLRSLTTTSEEEEEEPEEEEGEETEDNQEREDEEEEEGDEGETEQQHGDNESTTTSSTVNQNQQFNLTTPSSTTATIITSSTSTTPLSVDDDDDVDVFDPPLLNSFETRGEADTDDSDSDSQAAAPSLFLLVSDEDEGGSNSGAEDLIVREDVQIGSELLEEEEKVAESPSSRPPTSTATSVPATPETTVTMSSTTTTTTTTTEAEKAKNDVILVSDKDNNEEEQPEEDEPAVDSSSLPLALDVVDQQGEDDDDDKSETNNAIDIHPPSLPPPPVRPVDKVPSPIHNDDDEETNEILLTDLNANPPPADETNEILLIPPVEKPNSSGSSVGHGDNEEEEEEGEGEEEEEDSAIKTAKQLRLLHGQIDLDPLLLDDSCDASTTTTALPHISFTIVAKYGRTRWPWPPHHLLAELVLDCQTGYRLDPSSPDRLFCTNRTWIGQHPICVPSQQQQLPETDDDNVVDEADEEEIEDGGGREEKGEEDEEFPTTTISSSSSSSSSTTLATTTKVAPPLLSSGCSAEERAECEQICSQSVDSLSNTSSVSCSCYRGFRLDADAKSCIDVDECLLDNGGCEGECSNKPGSYLCSCPLGFRLASNGRKCIDKNECSLRNGHGPCQDVCTNTHGSYRCSCDGMLGTQLASDGHSCEDIDECASGNGGCSHSCLNTLGTHFCACPEGYMLADDWKTCEDIDECDYDPDNDQDRLCPGLCRNTIGSYICIDEDEEIEEFEVTCQPGFEANNNGQCLDVDECISEDNGGCSHICSNTNGTFACLCPAGLFLETDNRTCQDIDECATDNGGCSDRCVNVPSSYQCSCPEGYTLMDDWMTCRDVDECLIAEENSPSIQLCGSVGTCLNTAGSYRCICPPGYEDRDNTCIDTDECLLTAQLCGVGECHNFQGYFTCTCPSGYRFENHTCQDIDECDDDEDRCGPNGICSNTIGSFVCSCITGYYLTENSTCEDIDECENSPCVEGQCINEIGSFLCVCDPGYTLERNVCIDYDECEQELSPCHNGTCVNQIGSYRCDCPEGYHPINDTCYDVNECELSNPCVNGQCLNTEGSYSCRCQAGFKVLGNVCLDIDECESVPCFNGECINTYGSYECECLPGYFLQDDSCLDVDECEGNPCNNGTCTNIPGSYQCSCPRGYTLTDSLSCLDINECARSNGGCDQQCTNTPGSFYCSCNQGFYLDPENDRQCLDVNECEVNNGGCSQICINRRGNFSCECRSGYTLNAADRTTCALVIQPSLYCPSFEPPPGGYLHCSSRPASGSNEGAYKAGTVCSLRCRKGYTFRRHNKQLGWQNEIYTEEVKTLTTATTTTTTNGARNGNQALLLVSRQQQAAGGLAMLQGWKATQVWQPQDWHTSGFNRNTTANDNLKKYKEKPGRKNENEKRQLDSAGRSETRGRQRNSATTDRVKRQQTTQQQPFRRCGNDGKWKGKLGFCQALTCPPLTKPANGSVSPAVCLTGDAGPNQHCYFSCDHGFRVTGNPVRSCLPSLKWNPARPPPTCEKESKMIITLNPSRGGPLRNSNTIEVTVLTTTTTTTTSKPPTKTLDNGMKGNKAVELNKPTSGTLLPQLHNTFSYSSHLPPSIHGAYSNNLIHFTTVHPWPRIDCPRDMNVDLNPGKRTVEVFIPQPDTNVDWTGNVEAEPSWAKKLQAELGPSRLVISFRARNAVTEYTAICSFVLEVRDKEAPTVKDCPHDVHVRLNSLEPYATAQWTEPTFTDNMAVTHVIKSKEPGSLFAVGEHVVTYTAADASGNTARCQFTVNVSPALTTSELNGTDSCPRLEAPTHGDLNCLTWTWGQLCRPTCSLGYVFFRPLPSAVYLCGRDRKWKPGTTVPDCTPTTVLPEGGCVEGWEERRSGGKQCVGCAPGLHRPSNSTVCIPCPMGTYQDGFSASGCKSCPKRLTTCSMGARQCTDCKSPDECSTNSQSMSISTVTSTSSSKPIRRRMMRPLQNRQQRQQRLLQQQLQSSRSGGG